MRKSLQAALPNVISQVQIISAVSELDRLVHLSSSMRDSTLSFTKEIDQLVVRGEADIACHSAKDVGIWTNYGLEMVFCLPRCEPSDAWIGPEPENLPKGAVVGTDSARRKSLIELYYPHLQVQSIRGNVQTRIRQWQEGRYAAIVLSSCGLERLGLDEGQKSLAVDTFVPAMNQGIICGMMSPDHPLFEQIKQAAHPQTWQQMQTERKVGEALKISCQDPVGILAKDDGRVDVYWGHRHIYDSYYEHQDLSAWCDKLKNF